MKLEEFGEIRNYNVASSPILDPLSDISEAIAHGAVKAIEPTLQKYVAITLGSVVLLLLIFKK